MITIEQTKSTWPVLVNSLQIDATQEPEADWKLIHDSTKYASGHCLGFMLSKSCEYGLRATLYLASLDHDGYTSIGTISEELDISFPFLTKIFQQLNDAGLLTSQRGPKGGVALTKPAEEIMLYDIVVAIDGDELFRECVLGLPGCGDAEPCPLHDEWVEERDRLEELFRNATLAELPDVRLAVLD